MTISFDRDEERSLLEEWFASTSFDVEPEGVPELDPEEDDEDEDGVETRAGDRVGHVFHGNQWANKSYKVMVSDLRAAGYQGPVSYTKTKLGAIYDAHMAKAMQTTGSSVNSPTGLKPTSPVGPPNVKVPKTSKEIVAALHEAGYNGPTSYTKATLTNIFNAHVNGVGDIKNAKAPKGTKVPKETKIGPANASKLWHDSNNTKVADWGPSLANTYASYKGGGYYDMNMSLRKGHPTESAKRMQKVFDGKSVAADGTLTLHRGTTLPKNISQNMHVGGTFQDKGFMSTSYSPNKAFGGSHKFVITAPNGTKVLAGTAYEKELILNAGTKFKITDIKKPSYGGPTVVHMTVVG